MMQNFQRRTWMWMISIVLLAGAWALAAMEAGDDSRFLIYLRTPFALADRPVGYLPAARNIPPPVPSESLWYVRFVGSLPLFGFDHFAEVLKARHVPGVDFSGNRDIINEVLLPFQNLTQLRLLWLRGTSVDDRGLLYLFRLQNLESLLMSERITDDGMAILARFPRLGELGLAGAKIHDSSLGVLEALPNLRILDIGGTLITDAGLKSLQKSRLWYLRLPRGVTDKGMGTLKGMQSLLQLDLSATQVSDSGLSALKDLPRLSTLFLNQRITDKGVATLAKYQALKRLDLSGADISSDCLESLSQLQNLEELALSQTRISDTGLEALKNVPHLRFLEISDTAITPQGYAAIAEIASLQVISLSWAGQITIDDLAPFGKLGELRTLIINGIPMDDDVMRELKRRAPKAMWRRWLLPEAFADDNVLQKSPRLKEKKGISAARYSGLQRIHYVEAELQHGIPAVCDPNNDYPEETPENFLGEFIVSVKTGDVKQIR